MTDDGLFDAVPPLPRLPPGKAAARRRQRHLDGIAAGGHPLSTSAVLLPLHPLARRDGGRERDGSPRCGGCVHRRRLHGGARAFPKCTARAIERSRTDAAGTTRWWTEYPRATHGEASDVAAWWPACTDYSPRKDPTT